MTGLRTRLIGVAAVGAMIAAGAVTCTFSAREGDIEFKDAAVGDAYIPDAGTCTTVGRSCAGGEVLRTCIDTTSQPTEEVCNWGCLELDAPHCGRLQPSANAVLATDLDLVTNPQLEDATIAATENVTFIDTDSGSITGVRDAATGIDHGIEFVVRNKVGVFKLKNLRITGVLRVRGANALALVTLGDLDLEGRLDVRGDCTGTSAGPGGSRGGDRGANGTGDGGGAAGKKPGPGPFQFDSSGGGGGGHGADGGKGGKSTTLNDPAGGKAWGDPITVLIGGSGGGGGGAAGGAGGGGGGAVQLVANGRVRIAPATASSPWGINAGGCGGQGASDAGGGGGAGGTIIVEAKFVELAGNTVVAVNGGGGGAGGRTNDGGDGSLDLNRAGGGRGQGAGNSDGGDGAAAGNLKGEDGSDGSNGGGGGGGVGRILINSWKGQSFTFDGSVSPRFTDTGTSSTRGTANVQ